MTLPQVPAAYNPAIERERSRKIELGLATAHKREQDVEIGSARLIMTDESTGQRYHVYLSDGELYWDAI